jgi:hypothetical protein
MVSERDDEEVRALLKTLKVGEPNGAISQRLALPISPNRKLLYVVNGEWYNVIPPKEIP